MVVRILLADDNAADRDELRRSLQPYKELKVVGLAANGKQCVELALRLSPDVVLMDSDMPILSGFEAAEQINRLAPQIMIIMLGDLADPDYLRRAMLSGAREYLVKPPPASELLDTIAHVMDIKKKLKDVAGSSENPVAEPAPQVIAVASGKGGVGTTTIATNLAIALMQKTEKPTVLVDLDAQFGDVATMLNLTPKRSIIDLLPYSSELEPELVEGYLTAHEAGVKLLVASINSPKPLGTITAPAMENIINTLKVRYQYIVCDLPTALDEVALRVLVESHWIFVVSNLHDIPSVRAAKLFCQAIKENAHNPHHKIGVIVNRVTKANVLRIEDVEKSIEHPVIAQLPNDSRTVNLSVNRGTPAVIAYPNSTFANGLRQIAQQIIEGHSRTK